MNFINDRQLARRFKENSVPERERFYYFLIFTVLMSLMMTQFSINSMAAPLTSWTAAADVTTLIVTIIGSIILFKTNMKGDGKEFIERYVCLGFPITIQVVLITIPLAIVLVVAGADEGLMNYIITIFGVFYLLGRMFFSLKIASGQ